MSAKFSELTEEKKLEVARIYLTNIRNFLLSEHKKLDKESNEGGVKKINSSDKFTIYGDGIGLNELTGNSGMTRIELPVIKLDDGFNVKLGITNNALRAFYENDVPVFIPFIADEDDDEDEDEERNMDSNEEDPITAEENFLIDVIASACTTEESFNNLQDVYAILAKGIKRSKLNTIHKVF